MLFNREKFSKRELHVPAYLPKGLTLASTKVKFLHCFMFSGKSMTPVKSKRTPKYSTITSKTPRGQDPNYSKQYISDSGIKFSQLYDLWHCKIITINVNQLPFLLKSRCSKLAKLATAGGIEIRSLSETVNFLSP